jgi:hypothetical protein
MILLVVTAIPNTKFPNFWCDILLIPMMQKCHQLIDLDWKRILLREIILLPWRILDLTIMPGLLCDQSTLQQVRDTRSRQLLNANNANARKMGHVIQKTKAKTNTQIEDSQNNGADSSLDNVVAVSASNTANSDCETVTNLISIPPSQTINGSSSSHETMNTSNGHPHVQEQIIMEEQTKKVVETSIQNNDNDSDNDSDYFDHHHPTANSNSIRKDDAVSMTSPVARSRVAASSLHLRKFSREHHVTNISRIGSTSTSTTSASTSISRAKVPVPPLSAFHGTTSSTATTTITPSPSPTTITPSPTTTTTTTTTVNPLINEIKNETDDAMHSIIDEYQEEIEIVMNTNAASNKRDSLNHRLRNFITGDSNIRIRDYLFDVDLPSVPSRDAHLMSPSKSLFEGEIGGNTNKGTYNIQHDDNDDDHKDKMRLKLKELQKKKKKKKRSKEHMDTDTAPTAVTVTTSIQREKNGSSTEADNNDGTIAKK